MGCMSRQERYQRREQERARKFQEKNCDPQGHLVQCQVTACPRALNKPLAQCRREIMDVKEYGCVELYRSRRKREQSYAQWLGVA